LFFSGGKVDVTSQLKSSRSEIKEKSVMKLVRETGIQQRNSLLGDLGTSKKHMTGKRSIAMISGTENANESSTRNRLLGHKQCLGGQLDENQGAPASFSSESPDKLKPSLLKLKFKRPHLEQPNTQSSQPDGLTFWSSQQEEQLNVTRGQRSKRKRPSMDKVDGSDGKSAKRHQQGTDDEVIDANWILRKLGKDAIGKRIEVHQDSDSKWSASIQPIFLNITFVLNFILSLSIEIACLSRLPCLMKHLHFFGLNPYISAVTN
jgi:hypothetical protein